MADLANRMIPLMAGGRETPPPSALPYGIQEAMGYAQPMGRYSRDFPEMQAWESKVRHTFLNQRVIRGDSGELLTPAEYAVSTLEADVADSPALQAATVHNTLQSLLGLPGDSALAKQVLFKLKMQGAGGEEALPTGQTVAQREARRKHSMQESRYMTSPGMEANLAATDAYNLMSALQTDPAVRPVFADAGSSFLGGVGSVYHTFMAPAGEHAAEMRDLEDIRNEESAVNPIQARVKEALYWDAKAKEGNQEGVYKDSLTGGFRPQHSYTTLAGMANQGSEDNANLNTLWSESYMPQYLSGVPMFGDKRSPVLRQLFSDIHREVPIVPETSTPEQVHEIGKELREYKRINDEQYADNYPVAQRWWNKQLDSLDAIGAGWLTRPLKIPEYSRPSPVNNVAGNAPRYWADPATLLTLGAAAPSGIARAGAGGFAKAVVQDAVTDFPGEFGFGVGATMSSEPYTSSPSKLLQAIEYGNVEDEHGNQVHPNDRNYPGYLQKLQHEQKKKLERLYQKGLQLYPELRQSSPAPAQPWSGMPTGKM